MTIEVIKDQINKFVTSSVPGVMAIKGEWGVGKTFSWKKFLVEANKCDSVSFDRYSYVSLFGINSLDALKFSIFENTVAKALIGTEPSIDTFKKNAVGFGESLGRNTWSIIKEVPIAKWFNPAIQSLSFLSLYKTLICIDDLERKGSGLSVKDILGLISHLKEQKKCKVVILLNDGEDGLDDYLKYKEKVIDIELRFAPTPEECALIAFSKVGENSAHLRELSKKLGIRNIRILKKIEGLVENVIPIIEDLEPEVKNQVRHSLALFVWCYYCESGAGGEVPTLDFVTSIGYHSLGVGGRKEETERSKEWKSLLRSYEYNATDNLDLILAESVKTGYFVEDDIVSKALEKNTEILTSKSEGSFHEAWRMYHDSFDNNADAVIDSLYDSFIVNVKNISPTNLNGTVTLFRDLGENTKATEIIDLYVSQRSNDFYIFNLKEINFFGDIKDPEIVEKFNIAYKNSIVKENAKQVLERIAGSNGWSSSDEVVLANTSIDEFYALFKSEKGMHLPSFINTCLQFGQFTNCNEQQIEIVRRTKEALLKIASESEINRRRVRKYGVDV